MAFLIFTGVLNFALSCLLLQCGLCESDNSSQSLNIGRIGASNPASSSLTNLANYVYLLYDLPVPMAGKIFAFSAYVGSASPLVIQIWRPVTNPNVTQTSQFELVDSMQFAPNSSALGYAEFYVKDLNRSCINVKRNDYIGVYTTNDQPSWTYKPDATPRGPLGRVNGPINIGDVITFGGLLYPYIISLATYIVYDSTSANNSVTSTSTTSASCPDVLIPSFTTASTSTTTPMPTGPVRDPSFTTASTTSTTTPMPTGPVGDRGPIGVTGTGGASSQKGDGSAWKTWWFLLCVYMLSCFCLTIPSGN